MVIWRDFMVREFVNDILNNIRKVSRPTKRGSSFVDISNNDVCKADGTSDELLRCLAENMTEYDDDMMVCISEGDLPKSDASLRAAARKNGIDLSIRKRVVIEGVDDARCIRLSKDDRKRLLKGLS